MGRWAEIWRVQSFVGCSRPGAWQRQYCLWDLNLQARFSATSTLSRGIGISDTLLTIHIHKTHFSSKLPLGYRLNGEFPALENSFCSLTGSQRFLGFSEHQRNTLLNCKYLVKIWEPILQWESQKCFEHSPHHWRKRTGSRCVSIVTIHVLMITLLWKFTSYKYLHLHGTILLS